MRVPYTHYPCRHSPGCWRGFPRKFTEGIFAVSRAGFSRSGCAFRAFAPERARARDRCFLAKRGRSGKSVFYPSMPQNAAYDRMRGLPGGVSSDSGPGSSARIPVTGGMSSTAFRSSRFPLRRGGWDHACCCATAASISASVLCCRASSGPAGGASCRFQS